MAITRLRIPVDALRWGFVFAIGATIDWKLGSLPIGEFGLLAVTLYVLYQRVRYRQWPSALLATRTFRILLIAQAVAFVGYGISDLYRGSAAVDFVPVWGRLVFLMVDFIALCHLAGRHWSHLTALLLGRACGGALAALYATDLVDPWKFGFGAPATLALLVMIRNSPGLVWALALAGCGVLHLTLGFRSFGACCLIAAALAPAPWLARGWRFGSVGLSLVAGGVLLVFVYSTIVLDALGTSGSDLSRQAQLESGAEAFLESPLIGYGSRYSRTPIMDRFYARRAELRLEEKTKPIEEERELSLHSQLLTALTEGGLAGGAFFILFGLYLARAGYIAATLQQLSLRPIVLFLVLAAGFDLLMTPFFGVTRFEIALAASVTIAMLAVSSSTSRAHA